MVDLVITAANVVAGSGATVDRHYNAGETVTAGQAVYFDTATHTWKKADANGAAALQVAGGIALNGASSISRTGFSSTRWCSRPKVSGISSPRPE